MWKLVAPIVGLFVIAWVVAVTAPASESPPIAGGTVDVPIARCSASVPCPTGKSCDLSSGVGICHEQCNAKACPMGQIGYGAGAACVCVDAVGPGSPCTTAADCGTGYDCQLFQNQWGARTPPGRVCVPKSTPTCDGGTACTGSTTCYLLAGSATGRCGTQCPATATLCRFDEAAVVVNGTCACLQRDPAFRPCTSDTSCNWYNATGLTEPARACTAIATTGAAKRCLPPNVCKPAETCGNNLDDNCDGKIDEASNAPCGCNNEGRTRCDGTCSIGPGPANAGKPCPCGGTMRCDGLCDSTCSALYTLEPHGGPGFETGGIGALYCSQGSTSYQKKFPSAKLVNPSNPSDVKFFPDPRDGRNGKRAYELVQFPAGSLVSVSVDRERLRGYHVESVLRRKQQQRVWVGRFHARLDPSGNGPVHMILDDTGERLEFTDDRRLRSLRASLRFCPDSYGWVTGTLTGTTLTIDESRVMQPDPRVP